MDTLLHMYSLGGLGGELTSLLFIGRHAAAAAAATAAAAAGGIISPCHPAYRNMEQKEHTDSTIRVGSAACRQARSAGGTQCTSPKRQRDMAAAVVVGLAAYHHDIFVQL
jgi:hypothetical protein